MAKIILLTQKWEGWVGMIEIPDGFDLQAAHDEFMAAHFKSFLNDDPTDINDLDNWYIKAHEKRKMWWDELQQQGFKSRSMDDLFIEWVVREKDVKKVEYECFAVDEWKYERK